MSLSRRSRWLISAAAAVTITTGAWSVDRARQHRADRDQALRLARQIASQAEGLILPARMEGRKDPLGWAAGILNQGSEPRAAQVSKIKAAAGEPQESVSFDPARGELEYRRTLVSEDRSGLSIRVAVPYAGFLGARSRAANDALLACLVAAIALVGGLLWDRRRAAEVSTAQSNLPARPVDLVGPAVQAVTGEIRLMLTRLSVNIREMVREAQNLAVSAGRSRESVSALRDGIHAEIEHMREGREAIQELEQIALLAETAALNLVIEAGRLGLDGKQASVLSEELHRLVQRIRKLGGQADTRVSDLEKKLEPWSTDADLAFHAYDDVFRATQAMDTHIRNTTETLLGQAKLIQSIQKTSSGGGSSSDDKR